MTGIGNTNYSSIVNKALTESGARTTGTKSPGPFGTIIVNLTDDDLAHRSEVKERAKLKSETGERWTRNSLFRTDLNSAIGYTVNRDAINKVREKLKAEGVDPSKRTPTHEITDEQMEWLNSKYDLKFLSTCGISEPEFGNFMLDLAYLNVFSLEEVENMYAGVIPPESDQPQLISIYYYGDPVTGEGAGYVSQINGDILSYEEWLEERQTMIINNYIKAENPGLTDEKYQEMTAEYAAQFKERMKILEHIFEYAADYIENNIDNTLLKITDASEQLKEDFGSRL